MTMDKPSDQEHEYFKKLESEQKKKLRDHLDAKRAEAHKNKDKPASWMKCPKCGHDLEEIELHHVAIDKCKKCAGIWLDAGELDLLVKSDDHAQGIFGKLFSKKK